MSISIVFLIVLYISEISHTGNASYLPKQIDTIDAKFPGFVEFIPSTNNRNYHLVISGFDGAPFTRDYVYYVPNYTGSNASREIIELSSQNVIWPNEASFSNESILNRNIDPYG